MDLWDFEPSALHLGTNRDSSTFINSQVSGHREAADDRPVEPHLAQSPTIRVRDSVESKKEIGASQGGRLRGRVVDCDGRPLDRVSIRLASLPAMYHSESDLDGAFELDVRTKKQLLVRVEKSGFAPIEVPFVLQADQGESEPLLIRLSRGAAIRGRVVYPDPLDESIRIWVERDDNSLHGLRGPWSSTDQDPSLAGFDFANLAGGTYRVCVTSPGKALCVSEPITLGSHDDMSDVELRLDPESILLGLVQRMDGESMLGARLIINKAQNESDSGDHFVWNQARLDSDGGFRFKGLPSGDYVLRVESSGRVQKEFIVRGIEVGESRYEEIFVPLGTSLAGTVRDSRGEPAAFRRILLRNEVPGSQQVESMSDSSGRYLFNSLTPGTYAVQGSQQLYLGEGTSTQFDVSVRDAICLRGEVRSGNQMHANAKLWLHSSASSLGSEVATRTSESGDFEFAAVVPGAYSVRLTKEGIVYLLGDLTVPEIDSYHEFSLGEDASLKRAHGNSKSINR